MCVYPNIMAVPNSSPDHSVQDYIVRAKASPGKVTYCSSGIGTSLHLCGELFKHMAGVELTHIPYRGAGPALNDLIPGRVDAIFANFPSTLPYVQNGQLRGLAVTSAKRQPEVPNLPAIAEIVPGYDVSSWFALFVAAKTPPEIVDKLNRDAVAALDCDAEALRRLAPSERIHPIIADLADEAACRDAVASAVARFGRLEAVINNAGIGVSSLRPDGEANLPRIAELSAQIWDK